MINFNINKKYCLIIVILLIIINVVSCKKSNEGINYEEINLIDNNAEFKMVDLDLFIDHYIYLMKSQTESQMESIIIKNVFNELIIFDGGRKEDAEFLINIIKENGNKVKYWFLTHVHDDHIGAIYEICDKYKNEIYIENIYYNFLPVEFYYQYVGNEAGIVDVVNNKFYEYQKYMLDNKNYVVNIKNDLKKGGIIKINDVLGVEVLNTPYRLNHDVINNSSIVYKAYIENKTMIVLGDLAYYGGEKLIEDYEGTNKLKSDIVVIAHHGQNGVDYPVYKKISASIALWTTTKNIYENKQKKYNTDETKKWMEELNTKYQFVPIEKSYIIK